MDSRLSNKRTVHLFFLRNSSRVDTVISSFSLKHVRPDLQNYFALIYIQKNVSPWQLIHTVRLLGSLEYLHCKKKEGNTS